MNNLIIGLGILLYLTWLFLSFQILAQGIDKILNKLEEGKE